MEEEIKNLLKDFVEKFENGWPNHVTGSVGGLGHMPDQRCAACEMMSVYNRAVSFITRLDRDYSKEGHTPIPKGTQTDLLFNPPRPQP